MRLPFMLLAMLLLAACDNGWELPSEQAAQLFASIGEVPDCAVMRGSQQQDNFEGGYMVYAVYDFEPDCGAEWNQRLEEAGWEVQLPHGEWVRSWEPMVMATSGYGDSRTVFFDSAEQIEGVFVFQSEEIND